MKKSEPLGNVRNWTNTLYHTLVTTLRHHTPRHHTLRHHTLRHHTLRHHTLRHHTLRHHTLRHHTLYLLIVDQEQLWRAHFHTWPVVILCAGEKDYVAAAMCFCLFYKGWRFSRCFIINRLSCEINHVK